MSNRVWVVRQLNKLLYAVRREDSGAERTLHRNLLTRCNFLPTECHITANAKGQEATTPTRSDFRSQDDVDKNLQEVGETFVYGSVNPDTPPGEKAEATAQPDHDLTESAVGNDVQQPQSDGESRPRGPAAEDEQPPVNPRHPNTNPCDENSAGDHQASSAENGPPSAIHSKVGRDVVIDMQFADAEADLNTPSRTTSEGPTSNPDTLPTSTEDQRADLEESDAEGVPYKVHTVWELISGGIHKLFTSIFL